MCGIAGIAARAPEGGEGVLAAMREALRHRGPDDAGVWWSDDGRVGLAHRRLSILDLSPAGHQPMADASGRLWMVFNGEIYNFADLREELRAAGHRFRSGSDTEVVLAAWREWGAECLPRLQGMFALALYDADERTLYLARDRAGEKPLFYHAAGGRLWFGSELKALLADPRVPRRADPEALGFYLAYGYVPGARSLLQGVSKLPAAHAAAYRVDEGTLRVWRYWSLPAPFAGDEGAPAEPLERELEALLADSVRRQLVADVPVAVLLSGGIDSSLVTAMAARACPGAVKTFTVAFPGHGRFDEARHARVVARHFGTDHRELPVEPATVEILPELARQYDEPLGDSSLVPTYLVSRLVRREATVALGGDGGDELFGGYDHYGWIQRQEQARRFLPGPLRAGVARLAAALPVGVRGRSHLMAFGSDVRASIAHVNLYFDAAARTALLRPLLGGAPASRAPEAYKEALCAHGRTPLQQATATDFLSYLTDDILVKVDRASMLTSLEVRAPFLDHRIVEFAFSRVPDRLRATAGSHKVLLKRLAARVLPPELELDRKQGLSIPLAAWFKGRWGGFIEEVLAGADPAVFDRGVIRQLVEGQRRGLSNTHRLFALTMLELWRREYGVELAPSGDVPAEADAEALLARSAA
ncbi:MAG: asparagine synthase (glutamine-hydrolyzing) [Longimicrobiaceae bacterium]